MSKGCKVCRAWHDGREDGPCGHWCHFADAEDWHTAADEYARQAEAVSDVA